VKRLDVVDIPTLALEKKEVMEPQRVAVALGFFLLLMVLHSTADC